MKKKAKKTQAKKAKKSTATPKPDEALTYNPVHGSDNLTLEGILDCYRQLSPEKLDGNAAHIRRTMAETERKLQRLFAHFGREVSQDEIFWWEQEKNKYECEKTQQRRTPIGENAATRKRNDDSV